MMEKKIDMMEGLERFKYRRSFPINVTKDETYEEIITIHRKEGISYPWNLFIEDKCKPDFSDLMLTTEDGEILPYEIYVDGPNVAYMKATLPGKIGENTFYFYYGAKEEE